MQLLCSCLHIKSRAAPAGIPTRYVSWHRAHAQGEEFLWSDTVKGTISSSFFIGYTLTNFIGKCNSSAPQCCWACRVELVLQPFKIYGCVHAALLCVSPHLQGPQCTNDGTAVLQQSILE